MWTEQETEIMRDIYRLMKRHADPADTVEYWQGLTDDAAAIMRRHDQHDMAVHFCVAACEYYQDQVWKRKTKA